MSNDIVTGDDESLLAPHNFEHYYRIANMMSKSDMVPKCYKEKPQDILLAMEHGRSLGMTPLSAVQNIAVINGKPSIYGDGILAICSGHPEFIDISETPVRGADKQVMGYSCVVKRKNRADVLQTYTIDDAKKAGLWGKAGAWSQYPARMLQMRARAFALRDAFADALAGVRVAEEVQDYREIKDVTSARDTLKSLVSAVENQEENI